MSAARVFISYVQENRAIVTRLVNDLRQQGFEVWFDRDALPPGVFWRDEIQAAIRQHEFFVACFSHEYNVRQRNFMNEELELAIAEIRLRGGAPWFIPVLLSGEIPDRTIGPGRTLRDIQFLQLTAAHWNEGVDQLVAALRGRSASRATVTGSDSATLGHAESTDETNIDPITLRDFLDHNALATYLDRTIAEFTAFGALHEITDTRLEGYVESLREGRIGTLESLSRALHANKDPILVWAKKWLTGRQANISQGICITYLQYTLAYPGPETDQFIEFMRAAQRSVEQEQASDEAGTIAVAPKRTP